MVTVSPPGNAIVEIFAPSLRTTVGTVFDHPRILTRSNGETGSVALRVVVPSALTIQAATTDVGACAVNGDTVECDFGVMVADQSAIVDLRVRANQTGTFTTRSEATATQDADPADSVRSVTIVVDDAPPSSDGASGGGSLDWLSLTLGALALSARRRRRIVRSA
jgi:hypothetical protein